MLAARLYGKEDIRVEEVGRPEPSETEILVKVKSALLCGTDVRMYKNGHKNAGGDCPLIIGHELSGVIEQVGAAVTALKTGQRVAVAPNIGCGVCDLCVSGATQLCPDYRALGISMDGGFAEYVLIRRAALEQGNVVELDESISYQEAALAEPLSCVYNGFERAGIGPADTVLVIGAGPIGIMHGLLAKAAGAGKVILNDLSQSRLAMCSEIERSFHTVREGLKDYVMGLTGGKGVDVCITACPSAKAQEMSLELMRYNGRVIFFGGLPKGNEPRLDSNLIHYRQLVVTGTTRSSLGQFRKTLELIGEKMIDVKKLISSSRGISEFPEALGMAIEGEGLKHEIVFG